MLKTKGNSAGNEGAHSGRGGSHRQKPPSRRRACFAPRPPLAKAHLSTVRHRRPAIRAPACYRVGPLADPCAAVSTTRQCITSRSSEAQMPRSVKQGNQSVFAGVCWTADFRL
jgi:hypothetical protein